MLHGMVLALVSALAYSTLPILTKLAYQSGLDRGDMLIARFASSSLVLLAFLWIKDPKLLRVPPATLLKAALIGGGVFALQTTLFFSALELIPASTATLILYFYPLSVTAFSVLFLKMKLDRTLALSLVLVLAGCCSVIADTAGRELVFQGVLAAVGSLALYTVYLLLVQSVLRRAHPLSVTFYMLVSVTAVFCATGRPESLIDLTAYQFSLSLALGLVPTVLAISLLFLAIEKIGAARSAVVSTFEPAATILAAWLILGENVTAMQVAGLVLIVGGILLPNVKTIRDRNRCAHSDALVRCLKQTSGEGASTEEERVHEEGAANHGRDPQPQRPQPTLASGRKGPGPAPGQEKAGPPCLEPLGRPAGARPDGDRAAGALRHRHHRAPDPATARVTQSRAPGTGSRLLVRIRAR